MKALIISRLPTDRSLLAAAAAAGGFEPVAVADPVAAVVAALEHAPELIVLDEDQVEIDVARYGALLQARSAQSRRLTLARGKAGAPRPSVPSTVDEVRALAERMKAAVA